ncbi:hypothetical protein Gotur_002288 [Gossypium turneri]
MKYEKLIFLNKEPILEKLLLSFHNF